MSSKPVTISVPEEYHLKKERNNFLWNEALKIGVDILSKLDLSEEADLMKEKDEIKQEIMKLKNRLRLVENNLEMIREQKKVKKDPNLKQKERMARAIKANNPLRFAK